VAEQVIGPRGSLFMVADGMGGAAAGEIASSMAAQQIFDHLAKVWSHDPDNSPQQFALRMREAVEHANAEIHAYASEHPEVRGMGTTLTAAGVHGPNLFLAQVGDSRAYLIRDGVAFQLTRPVAHPAPGRRGELTEEEAETNARRNIILQALGPDPRVKVVLSLQRLNRGDVLVVCSDGLTGLVRKTEIAAVVAGDSDLDRVCETLISLANERGGPDNITVVAARFHGDGLPETSDSEEEPQHNVRGPGDLGRRRQPYAHAAAGAGRAPLRHQQRASSRDRTRRQPHGRVQHRPPGAGGGVMVPPPLTHPLPHEGHLHLPHRRTCRPDVVVEKSYAMLGRAPQADVRFGPDHDLPVSGRHAAVVFRDGDWILRDLASTNGTFVNGERIKGEHQINDQDLIRLGDGGPMLRFGVVRGLASQCRPGAVPAEPADGGWR
jgi:protein phosphatase